MLKVSGLELGPSDRGDPQSGRGLRIVEDDSEMKGYAGQKLTLGKLDMMDMILDSGVESRPRSFSTRAVIPTLVAHSVAPMNICPSRGSSGKK